MFYHVCRNEAETERLRRGKPQNYGTNTPYMLRGVQLDGLKFVTLPLYIIPIPFSTDFIKTNRFKHLLTLLIE